MLSKLQTLLPPTLLADDLKAAADLPRAVMMRANFIPGVRQRLGWRGIRECMTGGLTLKIAGQQGVYGISSPCPSRLKGRGCAEFELYYFPSPDEELLESFSVEACFEALRDDYLDRVREFSREEALMNLFGVARLLVVFNGEDGSVCLELTASERQVLISEGGIEIIRNNSTEQVVAPGEVDQNLPALETVWPLFSVIAASFSFCLSATPGYVQRWSRPAQKTVYTCDQRSYVEPVAGVKELRLGLAWGAQNCGLVDDGKFLVRELYWSAPANLPQEYADEPWWTAQVPGRRHSLDKNSMGITDRPKLIVLTGFLGAGKTSFLNHFIEHQASRNLFVAIVQNEIGAKGLDSRLLGQNYAVTEMDEGCVCCTLAGNLNLALSEILSGFQPDFVVLETTGLANPANFLHEIAELDDLLEFCSITTCVDASQGLTPLEKYPVAREQLLLADVVLLNKTDLAEPRQLAALELWLQQHNPLAQVYPVRHGDVVPTQLYGVDYAGQMQAATVRDHAACDGHTHLEQGISSMVVTLAQPLARQSFLDAANSLPPQVLRVKGVLEFRGECAPQVYQYVPGSQALTPATGVTDNERFLVLIGEDIRNSAAPFLEGLSLQG